MSEKQCPLTVGFTVDDGRIPATCWSKCEGIFTRQENAVDYDLYNFSGHGEDENEEERCLDTTSEHSHAQLEATSIFMRAYVTVDQCGEGHEIGEQGYRFRCSLPAQKITIRRIISTLDGRVLKGVQLIVTK